MRFERAIVGFRARIIGASEGSERKLTDEGVTCSALAGATAVTLALLIDAEPSGDSESSGDSEDGGATASDHVNGADQGPPANAPSVPGELDVSARPAQGTRAVTIQAGAVAVMGAVRELSWGPAAGVGLRVPGFFVGLGGLWLLPGRIDLGPGQVTTSFVGGRLEACFAAWHTGSARFDLCSGLLAGFTRAEAHGYTKNESRARPWLALPLELAVRSQTVPLGWEAGIAALVPLRRQDFEVGGAGIAYRSTPIAGIVWLRAVGAVPW